MSGAGAGAGAGGDGGWINPRAMREAEAGRVRARAEMEGGAGAGAGAPPAQRARIDPAFIPGADSRALGYQPPRAERVPDMTVGTWVNLGGDELLDALTLKNFSLAARFPAFMAEKGRLDALRKAAIDAALDAEMGEGTREELAMMIAGRKAEKTLETAQQQFLRSNARRVHNEIKGRIKRLLATFDDADAADANKAAIELAALVRRSHILAARGAAEDVGDV